MLMKANNKNVVRGFSLMQNPYVIASRRRGNLDGGIFLEIASSLTLLAMTQSQRLNNG
jgi:hypothetical protein